MGLSEAEWLKELERLAAGPSADGLTVPELSERLGKQERDVRALLKRALAEGRLKRGWRRSEALDGRMYQAPVYIVTPKPAKPSGLTKGVTKGGSGGD